jgi:UDP-2-acetamido-3-amino-2,3-dideoxy-glucuronate N-acetyltransferase
MGDKNFFIHESSYMDDGASIGEGTKVWHFSNIMKGAKIGSNCILGQNVFVASNVVIGDNVKIQNNVSLYDGVHIEDDAFIGPSVVFTNVINPRSFIERKSEFKKTLVCKGSSIGANSTIICGNNIGSYSIVGAAAVVTRDIIDHSVSYGSPAVARSWVCKCGKTIVDLNSCILKCEFCNTDLKINDIKKKDRG